jgi:hypothetical protein
MTRVPLPLIDASIAYAEPFERAWSQYPRRRGTKHDAWKAWNALRPRPRVDDVLAGIAAWMASKDWQKDGGDYIPAMSRWLRSRAWETHPPSNGAPVSSHAAVDLAKAQIAAADAEKRRRAEAARDDDARRAREESEIRAALERVRRG